MIEGSDIGTKEYWSGLKGLFQCFLYRTNNRLRSLLETMSRETEAAKARAEGIKGCRTGEKEMEMKKRVLAGVMAVVLAAGMLTACGQSSSADTQADGSSQAEEDSSAEEKKGDGEEDVQLEWAQPLSFEGTAAEASTLYVEPVEGLTDDFIRGVDISSYLSEIESGVVYRDFEGNVLDERGFFGLLAESGVNCVRIRVWNDPCDKDGNSYGGGHNDLATAVTMGQWASEAGLQVLIDFHYSDFWADPSKQKAPKEWAHYTIEDKEQALYDFTAESLNTLLEAGVNVTMVQIGNETNNGMAGETEWDRICRLMDQGSQAVRKVSEETGQSMQIAVHFTNPDSASIADFAGILEDAGVSYDVFAVSYYPFWHGTTENLTEQLKNIAQTYDKKVMVAETSYIYTAEDGDGTANSISADTDGIVLDYDISVQGQANAVRDVIQAVRNTGDAGIGVFYWEPAWIPVGVYDASSADAEQVLAANQEIWETYGSGWASSCAASYDPNDAGKYYGGSSWDNQAMFDFEGNPLESLKIFRYLFSGTDAELSIIRVEDLKLEFGIGEEIRMPEQVPARLNNNATRDIPVTWDEQQVQKAQEGGAGVYEIEGIAAEEGTEYPLTAALEVKRINYIKNPGLEEASMSMWKIDGAGVGRVADNNKLSGDYSLKFWSENTVSFTVSQEIEDLPAGSYELGAFLQGGDAGSNPVFELYITVNGETYTAQTGVTAWQKWDNPEITDIQVPEGAQVTVGVKVEAAAGAWGAWDDFYLYESGE